MTKHSSSGAAHRRRIASISRTFTSFKRQSGREALRVYLLIVLMVLVFGALDWQELTKAGAVRGITIILASSFLVVPIAIVLAATAMVAIRGLFEAISERTSPGRHRRKYLRRVTVEIRKALRMREVSQTHFDRQRDAYRHDDIDAATENGLWTRVLARRVQRLKNRLVEHVESSYHDSLSSIIAEFHATQGINKTNPLDQTEVAWTTPAPLHTFAAIRAVDGYAPLIGSIAFERRLVPGTPLVFSPRWVFDLVEFFEQPSRQPGPWYFGPGTPHRHPPQRQCVPLNGVDKETVLRLFEPYSQGPFADLHEAVHAASLV
jgi:hypothetical protein